MTELSLTLDDARQILRATTPQLEKMTEAARAMLTEYWQPYCGKFVRAVLVRSGYQGYEKILFVYRNSNGVIFIVDQWEGIADGKVFGPKNGHSWTDWQVVTEVPVLPMTFGQTNEEEELPDLGVTQISTFLRAVADHHMESFLHPGNTDACERVLFEILNNCNFPLGSARLVDELVECLDGDCNEELRDFWIQVLLDSYFEEEEDDQESLVKILQNKIGLATPEEP